MKFSDLNFEPHPLRKAFHVGHEQFGMFDKHSQAIWECDDAKVSIVSDGNGKLYEVMLIELDGEEVSSIPINGLNRKEVVEFLKKVEG